MGEDRYWVGEETLQIVGEALDVRLVVHQYKKPRYVYGSEKATNEVNLFYNGSNHYGSVEPL